MKYERVGGKGRMMSCRVMWEVRGEMIIQGDGSYGRKLIFGKLFWFQRIHNVDAAHGFVKFDNFKGSDSAG